MGRLITSAGYAGAIGGTVSVFGTAEAQTITVADTAGTVTFDASFNKGGDIIVLSRAAASYNIAQSGSNVILISGDNRVVIPVGTATTTLQFADGDRQLAYNGGIKIGGQAVTTTAATIKASAAGRATLSPDTSIQPASLILNGDEVWVGGNAMLFGSSASEAVHLLDVAGKVTFDASFNKGDDTLYFKDSAAQYRAIRSGSSMMLSVGGKSYLIPVGTTGLDVNFGTDIRSIKYTNGDFMVANQTVTNTSSQLTAPSKTIFSGTVYERGRNDVYDPADVGSSPVTGVSISTPSSSNAALTNSSGKFNIQAETSALGDLISFRKQGYQDMFFSTALFGNATSNVNVGLYPTQNVKPIPGFIKGVGLIDGGGWQVDAYKQGYFKSSIDHIVSVNRANTVQVEDPIFIQSIDAAKNVKMGYNVPGAEYWRMLSVSEYSEIINYAHQKNLNFILRLGTLQVNLSNTLAHDDYANIPASDLVFWNNFFNAYKEAVIPYVRMARDLKVEYLDISPGSSAANLLPVAIWKDLVDSIRAEGYQGKLLHFIPNDLLPIYDSNSSTSKITDVVNLFDAVQIKLIDVDHYSMFNGSNRLSLSQVEKIFEDQLLRAASFSKPVLLNIDIPSVVGATDNQPFVDQIINPNSPAPKRDLFAQSDIYEALFQAINATSAANGRIIGVIPTHFSYTDDPYSYSYGGNNPTEIQDDKSCSIRGKPAEAVLAYWYQAWG